MGEAKRRAKLDPSYGKKRNTKNENQRFQVLDFDGQHYELKSLDMPGSIDVNSSEEALATIVAFELGVPLDAIGGHSSPILWAKCDRSLKVGSIVTGKLDGNPKRLAKEFKLPTLLLIDLVDFES